MELLIVLLLVVLLVCVLVLFVYLLNQGRRSESINAQLLAKNQEALTVSSMADQKMVSRFDSILSQMQALQKNQIHSADSLEWVQEQVEGMGHDAGGGAHDAALLELVGKRWGTGRSQDEGCV